MHPAFARTDHRPWPVPARRWTWRQNWHDLLFAHWPVPAKLIRPHVPDRLELEEFEGTAWLGVVPFRMTGVMRRPFPDVPGISAFPELNLRTYVACDGRPGVWFLSLDATNPLAVWAARRWFDLPYHRARMRLTRPDAATVDFASARTSDPRVAFRATYGPASDVALSRPGTPEHWLTERYCLYAESPAGILTRTEVQHVPWPLQLARAEIGENGIPRPFAIDVPREPVLLHFARRVDVVVWSPEPVA